MIITVFFVDQRVTFRSLII